LTTVSGSPASVLSSGSGSEVWSSPLSSPSICTCLSEASSSLSLPFFFPHLLAASQCLEATSLLVDLQPHFVHNDTHLATTPRAYKNPAALMETLPESWRTPRDSSLRQRDSVNQATDLCLDQGPPQACPSSPPSFKPGTLESLEGSEPGEHPDTHHKRDTDTYASDDNHPYTHTIHDTHPNSVEHTTSAVWSEELQGIADATSLTEDLESWRIMEDLQRKARELAARLDRHPDKFSTEEYERLHRLTKNNKYFRQSSLDDSEYVLLEWLTTSEFADTLTYCSTDMNNNLACIPDLISRAHNCLCCKHALIDWCHAKGSAVCALLACNVDAVAATMGTPYHKPSYSAVKRSGSYTLASMVFHKSCLDFLSHVMHCVILGDTVWGKLSAEHVTTQRARSLPAGNSEIPPSS
jgi:hypothetical protein